MNSCTQIRRALVRTGSLNMATGASEMTGAHWTIGPCNSPLFGSEDRKRGLCPACASGWTHPENYPVRPRIEIDDPSDRAEAARLLRHVRIMARARGDYILSVRAWRNRAALEAADRWIGCEKKAKRCKKASSIADAQRWAAMWSRVGDALEKGWQH